MYSLGGVPLSDNMEAMKTDPEYTVVPESEQLDYDEDGSDNTDALDDATGDDTDDLGNYRNRNGPIWRGE